MGRIRLQRHSYRNKEEHKAILSPVPINTDPFVMPKAPFVMESHSFNLKLHSVSYDPLQAPHGNPEDWISY